MLAVIGVCDAPGRTSTSPRLVSARQYAVVLSGVKTSPNNGPTQRRRCRIWHYCKHGICFPLVVMLLDQVGSL